MRLQDITSTAGIAARVMRTTRKHRPAVWHRAGALCARDDEGHVQSFDRADDALAFAGVTNDRDPRLAPFKSAAASTMDWRMPHFGQRVLWIEDSRGPSHATHRT